MPELTPNPAKPDPPPPPSHRLETILPALSSIITPLVWPVFAAWAIWFVAHHHAGIVSDIEHLSPYIKTAEIHAGPFQISAETTQSIATALATPPLPASTGSGASAPSNTKLVAVPLDLAKTLAAGAVSNLDPLSIAAASKALRVLWVDPHPGNNINLQVAFQKLGFIVVTVQDDEPVAQAFTLARSFDVVITNMTRTNSPEAGLQTVKLVNSIRPGIPVIVYSASWAATHAGEEAKYGVKLITYRTDQVFRTVVDIAQTLNR